ncbi:hypothetical protein H2203_005215 [Taxawa tesnikishii (nom. ined.)]|nr:hypothetical protein H2203_005215 [Dothideales sp. JES 119]
MSGYPGLTDPRSYRLKNMRESLRHHLAHAICLPDAGSVATSLPNPEPPGPFVGKTTELQQTANGERKGSRSINAETLADVFKDSNGAATTALARIVTGL